MSTSPEGNRAELTVAIAADHAGYALKSRIIAHLGGKQDLVGRILDLGPDDERSVDYPDYARKVAECVRDGQADRGILICGTGIGMSMAANRIAGIRAALVGDEFCARMTRAHNDANVVCLGSRVIGEGVALAVIDRFLETPFEGGRHARRIASIEISKPRTAD